MRIRSADAGEEPAELCSALTGGTPVAPLAALGAASGTIQMWGVFLFAARSTSTALNSTHLPSGDETGSATRLSDIMSSKVKGCLACEKAGTTENTVRSRMRTRRIRSSADKRSSVEQREYLRQ